MVSTTTPESLTPLEEHMIGKMTIWYDKALTLKCPFMRRRASDILDSLDYVLRYYLVQNPSLMGPPLAYRCIGDTCEKQFGLTVEELADEIRKDWREDTRKGYYITGKVNTAIYRDDCMFNGPDPDMPIRGLRKYLNAASQLFDPSKSVSELLSLKVEGQVVVAKWRMNGRLRLPWKPWMPEVTGTTTYYTDMNGLICLHEETWDISVFRAFLQTLWPEAGELIWGKRTGP
jgi:hypothetical protein